MRFSPSQAQTWITSFFRWRVGSEPDDIIRIKSRESKGIDMVSSYVHRASSLPLDNEDTNLQMFLAQGVGFLARGRAGRPEELHKRDSWGRSTGRSPWHWPHVFSGGAASCLLPPPLTAPQTSPASSTTSSSSHYSSRRRSESFVASLLKLSWQDLRRSHPYFCFLMLEMCLLLQMSTHQPMVFQ